MNCLILEYKKQSDEIIELSIESFVTLTLWRFLDAEHDIKLKCVENSYFEMPTIQTNFSNISYEDVCISDKKLPMLQCDDGAYIIIGLCSVLRGICRLMQNTCSSLTAMQLLGFKENCLLSPSEVSLWTNYCEREIFQCASELLIASGDEITFPVTILKLENELGNPVRIHNVFKIVRDTKNNQSIQSGNAIEVDLEHKYCHGNEANLSDYILFVVFKLIFMTAMNESDVVNKIPLVLKWFRNMENEKQNLCKVFGMLFHNHSKSYVPFKDQLPLVEPNGKTFSLFKRQLGVNKKKSNRKKFTEQKDYDIILSKLKGLDIDIKSTPGDLNQESIDDSIIEELLKCGDVPIERLKRKKYQLKSIANEVKKIAKDGDIIVDFCSGTGHLGFLIAKLFPNCKIIILENKEESIKRAKLKSKQLQLVNTIFYQCNLVSNSIKLKK